MLTWLRRRKEVGKGRFFKTKVLMSVKLRLCDLEKRQGLTSWTEGSTRQLADDGFVIEVNRIMVDGFHIFTDAMKKGRGLELEWDLPADGGSMKGTGKVLWFKMAPIGSAYLFEAGVLLAQMGEEQRVHWLEFTRGLPS